MQLSAGQTTVTSSIVSFASLKRNPTFSNNLPGLRILIAPSGFKESLGPEQVADCIEEGLLRIAPEHTLIQKVPLHDGGEGFAQALVARYSGVMKDIDVTGPVGDTVHSSYGLIGSDSKIAVLDMAGAAGLRLVPTDRRNPTKTTTYGVGELIKAALDDGCTKIIIGCGDSGTSDGGVGMLQALGVKFLDSSGKELPIAGGGSSLLQLASISVDHIHPRLKSDQAEKVTIEAVCNIKNVLCGPEGVARVYGPQKGATPKDVEILSSALETYAQVVSNNLCIDIKVRPGSGASGGLGAGLMILDAHLRPRVEAINEYFDLDNILQQTWDFIITAEGSLDYQSTRGKMTSEVARRAKARGAQVIALAGTIGVGADDCYGAGIRAFASIIQGPSSLAEAIDDAETLLKDSAEGAMRMVMVGMKLASNKSMSMSKPQELVDVHITPMV